MKIEIRRVDGNYFEAQGNGRLNITWLAARVWIKDNSTLENLKIFLNTQYPGFEIKEMREQSQ